MGAAAWALIPAFDNDLPKGQASLSPAGSAAQAQLSTAAAAASWVCSVYTADPWQDDIYITGDGNQICSGAGYAPEKVNVTIQAYIGLGLWNNRVQAQGTLSAASIDTLQPYHDFSGDGTYTYRIATDAYAQSGLHTQSVQSLNDLRVTC